MPNLPVAVATVQIRRPGQPPVYIVASKDGYLKGTYHRDRLVHVPKVTMAIMGIDLEKEGMRRNITDAQASNLYNMSGGGSVCKCTRADCATSSSCSCRKKNKFCTSKCHGGRGNNRLCAFCPPSDS